MINTHLATVIEDSRSGFWGADAGSGDVNVRVVRNGDVQEEGICWRALPLRGATDSEVRRAALRKDDIIITISGDCGVVAHVEEDPAEPTIASNFVRILRFDTSRVAPRYIFHYMHSAAFRARLRPYIRGTTLKNLSLTTAAEQVRVPLPDIAAQRQIADILDKVDTLRAKRRDALAQLDTLTQSIFLDMFGDPLTNPKSWPRKQIVDVAMVITGNTPSRAMPEYYGCAIEWIKSDNINTPHYYLTQADEGLSQLGCGVARIVPAGSILVTCIAGSPDCIGNSAMTDREVAFNQQINAIVPFEGNGHYIYGLLRVGKRLVQMASTASMKGMVSKSRFERIPIIWPPEPLQDKFAERVYAVEEVIRQQRASLCSLNRLFASIQYRAFRGEL